MGNISKVMLLGMFVLISMGSVDAQEMDINVDIGTLYNLTIDNCVGALADDDNGKLYVLCNASDSPLYRHEMRTLNLNQDGTVTQNDSDIVSITGIAQDFAVHNGYVYILTRNTDMLTKLDTDLNIVSQWYYNTSINTTIQEWTWDDCINGHWESVETPIFPSNLATVDYEPYEMVVDDGGILVLFNGIGNQVWCNYELRNYDFTGGISMITSRSWGGGVCTNGNDKGVRFEYVDNNYAVISTQNNHNYVVYNRQAGARKGGYNIFGGCNSVSANCPQTANKCYHLGDYPLVTTFATVINNSWSSTATAGVGSTPMNSQVANRRSGVSSVTIYSEGNKYSRSDFNFDSTFSVNGSMTYSDNYIYTGNNTHITKTTTSGSNEWQVAEDGLTTSGWSQSFRVSQPTITSEYVINIGTDENLTIRNKTDGSLAYTDKLDSTNVITYERVGYTSGADDIIAFVKSGVTSGSSVVYWMGGDYEGEAVTVYNVDFIVSSSGTGSRLSNVSLLVEDCNITASYGLVYTDYFGEVNYTFRNDTYYQLTFSKTGYSDYSYCSYFGSNSTNYINLAPISDTSLANLTITTNVSGVNAAATVYISYDLANGTEIEAEITTDVNGQALYQLPINTNFQITDSSDTSLTCNMTTWPIHTPCQYQMDEYNHNLTIWMEDRTSMCFKVMDNNNNILDDSIVATYYEGCNATDENCTFKEIQSNTQIGNFLNFDDNDRIRVDVEKDGFVQRRPEYQFLNAYSTGSYCYIIYMDLNTTATNECIVRGTVKPANAMSQYNPDGNTGLEDMYFNVYINVLYDEVNETTGLSGERIMSDEIYCTSSGFNDGQNCQFWFLLNKSSQRLKAQVYHVSNQYDGADVVFTCDKWIKDISLSLSIKDEYLDDFGNPDATTTISSGGGESYSDVSDYKGEFEGSTLRMVYDLLVLILILGLLQGLFNVMSHRED